MVINHLIESIAVSVATKTSCFDIVTAFNFDFRWQERTESGFHFE